MTENIADERRLRLGVGVSIVREFAGELSLQGGVLDSNSGVGTGEMAEAGIVEAAEAPILS